jgi:hypothetical protein
MSKIRNYLLSACGFVVFVSAVLVSSPVTACSQTKASNVIVVNTDSNPVPTLAQGTTTIAGNVSVTNTPTVNLASGASVSVTNTPTVNLASGTSVSISNTTANPVLVRSMNDAVRQIFQKQTQINMAEGEFGKSASFFVPAGKRLVIEHVSAAGFDDGDQHLRFQVDTNVNSEFASHFLVTERQGGHPFFRASQQMRAYADPGTQVQVVVLRPTSTTAAFAVMTISGYYVDQP